MRFGCGRQFVLCLLLWTSFCIAAPVRTFNYEYLSVKDGLAQETVTVIVQDQQGYMWFGSQHGLSRFDGVQFTVYKTIPDDPHSLADNWVQALYVDKKNQLWVGTRGGLQRFDPASDGFVQYLDNGNGEPAAPKRHVQAIIGDGFDQLWVATSAGLLHFNPATAHYTVMQHNDAQPATIANDQVSTLALDAHGTLWVGTKEGLDKLPAGAKQFQHFRIDSQQNPNAAYNAVEQLWVDKAQQLWIVTLEGLVAWQPENGTAKMHRFNLADGLSPGTITAFLQDRDGSVWIGNNTKGLLRWDASLRRFIGYPSDPRSPAGNEVSALFQDQGGTLWVGTWTAGVKRVDLASGGFNRYYHAAGNPHTLSDNRIYGISTDGQGRLLLATFGGIDRLDPATGEVRMLRADPSKKSHLNDDEIVLTVYRDKHGTVWAGTSVGFGRFDLLSGNFIARPFHTGGVKSDSITGINSDHAGLLWISTRGGLYQLDPLTNIEHTYRHDPGDPTSLSDDWVKATLEDSSGALWVATDDGLNLLDRADGQFKQFHHEAKDPDSLSNDRVQCLYQDKHGTLWIGTNGGGLNKLQRGADGKLQFHSYTSKDGLGSDSIGAILEDDDGNLWLSTATGISRMSKSSETFKNYTSRDGMIEGYYYSGSGFRDADGTMYFGGANGLTAFLPNQIHDNPNPPPVVITDIQVQGKSLPGAAIQSMADLNLTYDQSVLALEFAALNYANPQRNRYSYQLQGFDKTWVDTDASKRTATYTNLEPGRYVFRVKASNKDDVWNETASMLTINIAPPYWKTGWFRALALLTLLGIFWMIERIRTRIHDEQKIRLEVLVSARTSEVQQQKQLVEQKKIEVETAHRNLSVLSDIGRHITATLDRNQVAKNIYGHIAQLMQVDLFCIWQGPDLHDHSNFSFMLEHGEPRESAGDYPVETSQLALWCTQNHKEVFISDVEPEGWREFVPTSQRIKSRSILAAPIFINDKVAGVISVQSEVSHAYQRIHLEMLMSVASYAGVALDNAAAYAQLQAAQQQLQLYLEDRERLFMSISHDLRSPITRLILRSELLEDDVLREEFYEDLDDLDMMVKGALQSVRDTDIHENVTEVSLDVLIKRILRGAQLGGHMITYTESGLSVYAKPLALKRAIGNLLDNALFYGKQAEITVQADETYLDIQIRDYGPGVPDEALQNLTQSYVRLEHGRAQNAGGLGLGLSIVNSIAQAHGGLLILKNHPDGGLIAIIRLPVN